jgi:hypothetical protein
VLKNNLAVLKKYVNPIYKKKAFKKRHVLTEKPIALKRARIIGYSGPFSKSQLSITGVVRNPSNISEAVCQ